MMDLARHWRLKEQRYHLQGTVCDKCGAKYFPPRRVCLQCKSTELQPHEFDGHGELYSFTTLHSAPMGYESQVPYTVGVVKLDEGPLVEAQITDANPENLKIGQRMEMVTRKLRTYGDEGLIVYGYKFRPMASAS
jgi:uncharacterized protein